MDETNKYSALAATMEAHAHLAAARKQLIGQRLPLAGTQCDLDKAVADLRIARQKVEEALQVLETGQLHAAGE